MSERKRFFSYVIPSVLAFALSGVYAIVDGFFVGNSVGDSGLSAINIAYPVVALIQAVGTGFGMGGAVYYSICRAEKKEGEAREFVAATMWLLLASSAVLTVVFCLLTEPVLRLLGTGTGELLSLGKDYLFVISLGTFLQIFGVGLVPLIRNNGGATFAMLTMIAGFITNIVLDWLFVWVYEWSMTGAALATIIGQGVTMAGGFGYLIRKGKLSFRIPFRRFSQKAKSITKIGIAPFGLTLTPNISLILINRFSASYGGEEAIAVYACISYVISVVYLILQGVGDGSQPLMSQYYGEREEKKLRRIRNLAYRFALLLSAAGILLLFAARWNVGTLFGASEEVTRGVAQVFPVFLLAIPFIAVSRITTAGFYATEKTTYAYVLTYAEPAAMLVLLFILPAFGGQMMIWWGTAISRIFAAVLAVVLKRRADRKGMTNSAAEERQNV